MMSHVVAMSVNAQIEITWDRHHVTGYRPSIGSFTSPSAPKSPPVTSFDHFQRRLDNVSISSSGLTSTALGETLNSAASVATVGVLLTRSCEGPWDSWKDGKDATTLRSMRAESSTSFDLSINYSQDSLDRSSSCFISQSPRHTPAIVASETRIKSRDNYSTFPPPILPRIELDTQFVSNDVTSTSSANGSYHHAGCSTAVVMKTPGIFGLSNSFVVGSAFRRQMSLKLGQCQNIPPPPSTWHERDVIQRPPAFNPEYKVTENVGLLSTSSATSRDGSQRTTSSVCGDCSPRTSSTESIRPTFNINQPNTGHRSHVTQVNLLPVNMKPTFRISSDNVDDVDVDDDVFYNEDNTSDPNYSAALPAAVSTTQVNRKSVAMVTRPPESSQPTTTPCLTTNRIFSFSVQAACISKSVSSPVDGVPVTSQPRLYPVIPQLDLLTSSELGRRSLPVRASRITVCPISGDVMIVDTKQSLIQFYTSGGRLESCTEIESVSGGCFLHQYDHRRVAVSCTEPRGVVELYYRAGPILIHEDCVATIGPTLNVITYRHGFIAVQTKRLLIFSVQPYVLQLQQTINGHLSGCKSSLSSQLSTSKRVPFVHITDCSTSKSGDIIVLDTNRILVLSPDGQLIRSTHDPLLKPHPMSHVMRTLAVDFRSGAIVCCPETRRVMQFDTHSSKCPLRYILLEMRSCSGRNDSDTRVDRPMENITGIPTCIAVDTTHGRLFLAVMIDGKRSEVKVYQL